jgi:hypothetical protein
VVRQRTLWLYALASCHGMALMDDRFDLHPQNRAPRLSDAGKLDLLAAAVMLLVMMLVNLG